MHDGGWIEVPITTTPKLPKRADGSRLRPVTEICLSGIYSAFWIAAIKVVVIDSHHALRRLHLNAGLAMINVQMYRDTVIVMFADILTSNSARV
jgi:hypothetical protein